jgi:hypothetical protein
LPEVSTAVLSHISPVSALQPSDSFNGAKLLLLDLLPLFLLFLLFLLLQVLVLEALYAVEPAGVTLIPTAERHVLPIRIVTDNLVSRI